jgi:hypothetical protein
LKKNKIKVKPERHQRVKVYFLADGVTQEGNESLILHLNPTPPTLRIIPAGEAVFFRNAINLTIMDADSK